MNDVWQVVQVLADVPPAKDIQEMMKMLRKRAEKQKKEGEKKRFKTKMEATQQLAQKRMRTVASGSSAVMAKSATEAMRASKVIQATTECVIVCGVLPSIANTTHR